MLTAPCSLTNNLIETLLRLCLMRKGSRWKEIPALIAATKGTAATISTYGKGDSVKAEADLLNPARWAGRLGGGRGLLFSSRRRGKPLLGSRDQLSA